MWVFTQHGFFSVVRGDDTILPDGSSEPTVQVRARYRQHLEELRVRFPEQLGDAQVIGYDDPEYEEEYRDRDYEYRLFVPEPVWQELATALAADVTYSNFKGRVHARAHETRLSETPYMDQLYGVYDRMTNRDRHPW